MDAPGERPAGDGAPFPDVVFAPARPDIRPDHHGEVIFEVRQGSDGGLAMPVYSSVDRLTAALGHAQPWVALPLQNIRTIMGSAGVHRVVVDAGVQPGTWQWQQSDVNELERRLPW